MLIFGRGAFFLKCTKLFFFLQVHENFITEHTGVFVNLLMYMVLTFFTSIVAATLPVPTGVLIPAFKIGAGFGRMVGEAAFVFFMRVISVMVVVVSLSCTHFSVNHLQR